MDDLSALVKQIILLKLKEWLNALERAVTIKCTCKYTLTAASAQSELIASDFYFLNSPIILTDRSPSASVAQLQDAVSSVVGIQPQGPARIATVT